MCRVISAASLAISFWVVGEVISFASFEGIHLIQVDLNSWSYCGSHLNCIQALEISAYLSISAFHLCCLWAMCGEANWHAIHPSVPAGCHSASHH